MLGTDSIDTSPISAKFSFGRLIHVDAGGVAKGCKRNEDAPNFLAHVSFRPTEYVIHQFVRLLLCA